MNIILCVDDNNGMMFNNRRQSQDAALRQKISEITNGSPVYMNSYSANQFQNECNTIVKEDFLSYVSENDFCFIENVVVDAKKINKIYLFKWNRKYPADFYFKIDLKEIGLKRTKKEEFEGSSHKKITLEVYE